METPKRSVLSSSSTENLLTDISPPPNYGSPQFNKSHDSSIDDEMKESDKSVNYFTPPSSQVFKRIRQLKDDALSQTLKVPASPLMRRLGYGTGVGVYLMERSPKSDGSSRSPWAIKKLLKLREGLKNDKELYSLRLQYEASILKQLNHPNIVSFRAFGNPSSDTTFLAMEKASSSLGDLIEERRDAGNNIEIQPFEPEHVLKVGLNVCRALDYLHTDKSMVHGDLKGANVLVFGDFELIKLCDFGVARKLKNDGTVDGNYVGTEIWNPMEVVLQQKGCPKYPITSKADIYPFGLTIYEMLSLKPPHLPSDDDEEYGNVSTSTITSEEEEDFDSSNVGESSFEKILSKRLGTRPLLPNIEFDESYNKVLEIFYTCTEEDPSKRPTAEDIISLICVNC